LYITAAMLTPPTIKCRQDGLVGLPEQWQTVLMDVNMWQVRYEIIADEKPHQNPVIDNSLQTVVELQPRLNQTPTHKSTQGIPRHHR